jgi:lipid-binding SYLF domain-containing protein
MNIPRRSVMLASAAIAMAAATFVSVPAHASDATDASALVDKATVAVTSFANDKDFATVGPALARAKAVLIYPQVLKAGFILGGSGGSGVLMVRDEKTGKWFGPAFYTMGAASLGFQAGVSSAEMLMVINSQKALESLYANKLKLGTDVSVAVGPKGSGTGAALGSDFVVYAKAKGAFAGIAVDGAVLDVREKLNSAYYGKAVTPVDIVVKREVSNPSSASLQDALSKIAR